MPRPPPPAVDINIDGVNIISRNGVQSATARYIKDVMRTCGAKVSGPPRVPSAPAPAPGLMPVPGLMPAPGPMPAPTVPGPMPAPTVPGPASTSAAAPSGGRPTAPPANNDGFEPGPSCSGQDMTVVPVYNWYLQSMQHKICKLIEENESLRIKLKVSEMENSKDVP